MQPLQPQLTKEERAMCRQIAQKAIDSRTAGETHPYERKWYYLEAGQGKLVKVEIVITVNEEKALHAKP